MAFSKSSLPPDLLSFYFIISVLIVPIFCQIPPGRPVIVINPSSGQIGTSATVRCSSQGGDPTPTVKISRNSILIDETATTANGQTVNDYTFTVQESDHYAVYECSVANGVLQNPLTSTEYFFVVTTPFAPTLTGPTVVTTGTGPQNWTCVSRNGYPMQSMTMRNDNTQFTSGFTTSSNIDTTSKKYVVTGTLLWTPTIGDNGHTIYCDVSHSTLASPQTASLPLTVIAPLAVNAPITSYTPTIGNSVTLNCVVTSGIATSITWYKENVPITISANTRFSGGSVATPPLTITNVQQSDQGNYVCQARDAVGTTVNTNTIILSPQGTPPVVTIAQPSYSQLTGQQITLGCQYQSPNSPVQSVLWRFTNSQGVVTDPVVISSPKYSGSTLQNPSLTITSLGAADKGTYQCRATNLIGTGISDPTTLDVTGSQPVVVIPQNSYSGIYGNQVVIECIIQSANPAATVVYWQKNVNNVITRINNGDSGYQGSTPTTPSLTINFARTSDNGVYTCYATNAVGTGSSNPTTLTISGGLLSVTLSPSTANVIQGNSQTIQCIVNGQPPATQIEWIKDQTTTLNIANSNGKYTGGTVSNPALTITNFQSTDAGQYVCRATNAAGVAPSSPSTLTLIQPLSVSVSPPSGNANYGTSSYTIQCIVSGTNPSFVSWTKTPITGGTTTTISTGSGKYNINNSPTNPFLTILNIVEEDEADYACSAQNLAGTVTSSNARLIVDGAVLSVSVSPTVANVILNNIQVIQCIVSGSPSATAINWYRRINNIETVIQIASSNGKYSGGSVSSPALTINSFQSSDAGVYLCRATNAYGTATSQDAVLTFIQPLSITVAPSSGNANYGSSSYTIQCIVSGTNPNFVSWTKTPIGGGSPTTISTGSGKYNINNSPTNPFLTILNIVEEDEADYACTAQNVAGTVTSSNARLIVDGAVLSVSVSPTAANVILNNNQVIQCIISGSPSATAINWYRRTNNVETQIQIASSNGKYFGGTVSTPALTINSFQSSDAGVYLCRATNAYGTATSPDAVLTFIQPLSVTVSPPSGNANYGTSSYTIQCIVSGTNPTFVSWTKTPINGGSPTTLVTGSGKYNINNSPTNPFITIFNIVEEDEADYACTAQNLAGTVTSSNARLIVDGATLSVNVSPTAANVIVNNNQVIQCIVSGSPSATVINWYRRINNIENAIQIASSNGKYSGGSVSIPAITINSFQSSDAGVYLCRATNAYGTASSPDAVLTFIQPLSITVSPPSGNANYGTSSYTIQCAVSGTNPTFVSWTKTPIGGGSQTTISTGSGKYNINNIPTNPFLTIFNIVEEDEADYACTAQNLAGTVTSSNARLIVDGASLSVNVSPTSANVILNNNQAIQCIVSGSPSATAINWYRRTNNVETQIQIASSNGKYSGGSVSTPALTVNSFQSSDAGVYLCKATNAYGTASSPDSVLTFIQPISISIQPLSGTAIVGDASYTITCTVFGTNPTFVSWTKTPTTGGTSTTLTQGTGKYSINSSPTNPTLTISNIVKTDEADYACSAQNLAGTVTSSNARLTVNGGALTVTITPTNPTAVIGDATVQIQCTISGIPQATNWYWTFLPLGSSGSVTTIPQGTNSADYFVENSNTNPHLTIRNILKTDEGDFVCFGTNVVGTSQSNQARLTVTGGLLGVQISPNNQLVIQGNSQTLTCIVSGSPPASAITWTKQTTGGAVVMDLSTPAGKYSGGTTSNPSLTINNFQSTDAATYVCRATNAAGTASSTQAVLTYAEYPSVVVSPSSDSVLIGTSSYTITCTVTATPQATQWSWTKTPIGGGTPVTIAQINSAKYTVANSAVNPSLTIMNIDSSDQANYVCSATNFAGTRASGPAQLTVTGSLLTVQISPPSAEVLQGTSQTITCTVNGSPTATGISWTRTNNAGAVTLNLSTVPGKYSGGTIANPSLTINNFATTDAGSYVCKALNLIGEASSPTSSVLTYKEYPSVVVFPSSDSVLIGTSSYTITCTVTATPQATQWSWTKTPIGGGTPVTIAQGTNSAKYTVATSAVNPSLTIMNIDSSDQANYVCSATNTAGTRSSGPSQLTVTGSLLTVQISPPSAEVLQGTSQTITCTVTGSPAATGISWTRTNNAGAVTLNLSTVPGKYSGGTIANPSLTINNFATTDAGSYVCKALNLIGEASSPTSSVLTYKEYPIVVVSPTSNSVLIGTSSYTITCTVTATPQATQWSWTKTPIGGGNSVTIDQGTNTAKYTVANSAVNPSLTIINIDSSDQANYVCSATNTAGTRSSGPSQLTVTGSLLTVQISPPSAEVLQGTSQTITCTVNGSPTATGISWIRANNAGVVTLNLSTIPGKYSGGTISNPSLTINNFATTDAGSYVCKALNLIGEASSPTSSVLTYKEYPLVVVSPSSDSVLIGTSSYTITCTVTATPQATQWSWTKTPIGGGTPVTIAQGTNSAKYTVANSAVNPSLTIKNIDAGDQANYVCSATNTAGTRSSGPSQLAVTGGALAITITPTNPTSVIGDASVQIQCTISGVPQATNWYWTFLPLGSTGNPVNIPQGTNSADYLVENSNTNPHLTIRNIAKVDEGDYACFGTNLVGTSQSNQARLTVTGALLQVQISPSSKLVLQGDSQLLTCIVTGSPPATAITWTKESTSGASNMDLSTPAGKYSGGTTSNPSLTINNFQSTDAATYVCRATNAAGTASSTQAVLTYAERLTLTVSPVSGSADIGTSSYVINCVITGSPAATQWSWIKTPTAGGTSTTITMGTNTNKYTVANNANNPSLTIMGITTDDDANYVCQATNTAGQRTSAPARLLVTGSLLSVIVTPNLSSPNYGTSSITIQCAISGSPGATTVGWTKNAVSGGSSVAIDAANSQGKYFIVNSFTNPDLTINNINFNDDAYYVCSATNAVGKQNSGNARVQVIGSPPQVSIPSTTYNVVYGNDITIPCTIINANPTQTSIRWYRIDNNNQASTINVGDLTQYSGGTLSVPSLTILKADAADAGTYRCGAINVVGEGQSQNTLLNVIGAVPTVQLSKSSETVTYSGSVTIQCTITSQTPAATSVFWQRTRNGVTTQLIIDGSKYSGSTVVNPSLTISNAVFDDQGTYQCFAVNLVGIGKSLELTLTIAGDIPVVSLTRSSDTVVYGNYVLNIDCKVVSPFYPVLYVLWQKTTNGITIQLNVINSNGKYSGSSVLYPGLTIYNAVYSDSGSYICYAANVFGIGQSAVYQLTVVASLLQVTIPSPTYSVLLGNQIQMVCTVSGSPAATQVYWEKKNVNGTYNRVAADSRYSGGNLASPTLVIFNAAFSDKGTYRCLGVNAAGTANSIDTQLDVTGSPPTVTVGAPSYSVNYGSPVTLACTVIANPMYTTVSWTKVVTGNSTTVDLSNTAKYSGSVFSNPSLTISSADLNDRATYVCSASNIVGTGVSSGTVLNVVGGLLTVAAVPNSYSVQIGQTVTLGCSWSGIPSPYFITWQKVNNNVASDISVGRSNGKYVGSTVSDPSLTITSASNDDRAEYICTATNEAGRAYSGRILLYVTGTAPFVKILEESYSVYYGNTITLDCIVSSVPLHTEVKWKKIKGGLSTDIDVHAASSQGKYSGSSIISPSLVIINVDFHDEANYVCTATNQLGIGTSNTTLHVIGGLLSVFIPQNPYDVLVGNSITIPCIVTGNPQPTEVKWRKVQNGTSHDIDVINGGGKYSGSVTGSPSLTIFDVHHSDTADYQCTASNVEGTSASKPVYLNVIGSVPKVQIPAGSYSVNFGDSITLPCIISSNPPHKQVQWKKLTELSLQDIDVNNSNGKYSGSLVYSPDLVIRNAGLNDEASYMCTATNDIGTGQSQTTFLDLNGGKLAVTIRSNKFSVNAGQDVQMVCIISGIPAVTSVLWKKIPLGGSMSQDIVVGSSNGHYTGGTLANPSLTITNSQEDDQANYICTATNAAGTSESEPTFLNVVGSIPTVVILNPPYSVSYGQTVTIVCHVTSSPPADSITWTRTINNITNIVDTSKESGKYAGGSLAVPSLTITDSNISGDEGSYVCSATNRFGTGNSDSVYLDVIGGLLTVNVPQDIYTVQQGSSVQMSCAWSGLPGATSVLWKKYVQGRPINITIPSINGKYRGSTVQSPLLIINDARQEDEAIYLCTATNAEGTSSSQPVRLEVTGGVPVVTISHPSYLVHYGHYIILDCMVISNPRHTGVQWYKMVNGQYVALNLSNSDKYGGSTVDTPSLTIMSATTQDSANYVCSATNSIGTSQSSPTFLDIIGDVPIVQISTTIFPVLVGNQITLGCNVIADPAATSVYWTFTDASGRTNTITQTTNTQKYGGVTLSSPSLILYNAQFSDAGKYTCYAINSVGTGNSQTADLVVNGEPPKVQITLPNYSVDFGQSVTLGCTVTANPPHFRVFWRKTRNNIQTDIIVSSSNGKYSGATVTNPSLTINNAALDDQASYVCGAENSVNSAVSTQTILTVTGNIPVVNIRQSQYSVNYGSPVTLECTVTAVPDYTHVYWQKIQNGITTTVVVSNDPRLSGSTKGTPSLTFSSTNLNDVAQYICFANNSVGIGQSNPTSLIVSGAVPQVFVSSNSYSVPVGGAVTLQCVVNANPTQTQVRWRRIINGVETDVTGVGAVGSGSRLTGSEVNNPSLFVTLADFADEGNYICTATNAVGTGRSQQTFLDVTGTPPVVTVSALEFQGDFGKSVTMTCTVNANPKETRVYWRMLVNGVLTDVDMTSGRYSGSTVASPSLTISNLNKADQAYYQCFAQNSVATGSSQQTYLRVIGEIPVVTVQGSVSVTLGQSAVISCTVTANPAAQTVFWRKYNSLNQLVDIDMTTNNNNKYQGSTVGTPSLTILNTVSDDAGRYVCYATNAVGTGFSSTATTLSVVGGIPIVNIPQDSYSVNIGNQITLGCTVSATPTEHTIYWTKKVGTGAEVQVSKTNSAKYQGQIVNSPSLIILNTDFTDSATYYCYAQNAAGTGKSNPTVLTVIGNQPTVTIPLPQYSVNYDGAVTIPCTVTASPAATNITWKKIVQGVEQNIDINQVKYSGATTQNPSLTINNANSNDKAFYVCTATNSVGTGRSIQTYLDVVGAIPTVTVGSNSYSVLKTKSQELVCNINANPAATSVQWYRYENGQQTNLRNVAGKYNSPTVNSPNLIVNNADDLDRGYYVCTATNIIGRGVSSTTFLDVTGNAPLVTIPLTTYNGNIGGTVTIGCTVVANPAATSVWWQVISGGQSTNILQSTSKYSFSTSNPSLTISSLSSADKAYYVCYATNDIGQGNSGQAYVNVIGSIPIVTVPQSSYDANIGSSVTLQCTVSANPTHTSVYWKRVDANSQVTTITIDNSKYQGATVNNPSLTINNVQTTDRASYICFAHNTEGDGQSNPTYLNVIGSPPIVSIGSSSYSVAFGQSIQLVCTINANPSHFAVSWKKIQNGVETVIDSSAITNNPSKYAGGSVSQPSLTVKNADRNMDQAFYECSATNSIGTGTSSRTYLMVTGDVPLVQIPNSLYSVELGQNLVVPCTITSNPAHYTIQWKRRDGNGVETDLNVSDQTQYTNGNLNVPSLTILNAANDDKGFYICTATNAVGTGRSGLTYVDVTGSVLQVTVPQSAYNVNYGQTVQLVCTVTGTPAVQDVYWVKIRNGQSTTIRASTDPSKYSGVSLSNPSLTILNANEVDTAVYRCYGTNAVGTSNSQQTQLNVIGSAPSVTVGQGYTVNLGNSVTLQCTVIATPSATSVRWNKIQGGISSPIDVVNNPTKYSGSTTSIPSLTIYNADNNDQTSYTCQATNAAGTTVSTPTSLSVVGNIPIVRITQGQYSVVIGNTVTLECTVQANPTHYVVYWKRIINGVETDLPSSGRYSGSTVSNPSLTITNTVVGDIGSYVCFANNTVGRGQSAQTYLNVVGSAPVVSIPQSTYSTNIGNPVTLQCTVSANPIQTSVKWQRVDSSNNAVDVDMTNSRYSGSTVSSPSLTISNAVKADEGRYICMATNLVGTGTSGQTFLTVVGSSPTVTVPDPSYSVNRGSSVTLQCAYSANPAATRVRWLRNNVEIDLTNTLKYGGSLVSSASLIIKNADKNDEGTYVCQVTNDVGTGISTPTTLSVVGNPPTVTVATGAYTVNVGSSVTLQCAVTADPAATQVYWQRADGGTTTTIIIDNSKYSGSAVGNPSLVINNAAFTDAGTYYCYAVNSVGVGGSTQVVVGVTGNKPSVSLPRTSITANYGDDVTIACDIVANPKETSVYWQKSPISGGNAVTIDMTNTAKYSGSTVAVPALTIKKVDLSDIARYVCFAANSVGTGRSTNGTLNVVGSQPTVTIGQDTYTANIGNSIIITCTVSSFPAHTSVYWTKQVGGNPQMTISTTTTKYSISSNLNAPSLTIFDVDDSDAGMYRCFATNIVGTGQSSAATLNVIGNPPVVAASPALNSVRIGQSITLMCTITANPAATNVVWQKVVTTGNTDQYVNIDRTLSKYTGGTVQIPSLTINPVAEDDRGNYRCVASNAIGTTNSNQISLETIGDPPTGVKVTPTPIVVIEGNTIQATCTANGNPAPTFQWYKSTDLNTVISTGSELRVPNALDTNKGTYICRAMNKFGTNDAQVTVDVQFIPKVVISNLAINGTKGNSIDIKCTQTSNPLATEVYWTKITPTDSRTVIIDNIKYIGGSVSNPTLTITNLDGADEASYKCSARNSVGPGSSQLAAVKVDLNSAPIGIRIYPDGITVLEGHPFSMYCNATAYPDPQYQWFHDDIMIREGQVYSVDISDYNKHDGLYTCKAYNSKGFQQATIDVDVKFPPISSVKTSSISAVVGRPVTLSCDSFANPSAVKWNWYYNDILLTSVPDTQKTYTVDMNKATDAGLYSCVAFNEVGQSGKIEFTLTVGLVTTTAAPVTVTGAAAVGQSLALSGLSGGEIAAIVLGILFFILLLIALIVCCILQGCCICCAAAGAKDKERRITPDREITKVDIPRFYEVPTVVTREPSLISKRDVSLHMAPVYRPSNEYEITKYRVVRPEEYVGEQYITTTAARPYYLPPIEYTYDEEERRRRRRKKKKSKHHHDELRPDEQIILEERVVGGGDVYRTSTRSRYDDEVVTGPEFYFEAE